MNQEKRFSILYRLYHNNPRPSIELKYRNNFELLIAVMLSSQTTDKQVNKVTSSLFFFASSPYSMLNLGIDRIKEQIKSIGMFNKKSYNIINICKILIEKYNGIIPESRIALESLPGIGRKSASVILNVCFKWPTIAIDRHVFRFCNRTNFATGSSVDKVESKLLIKVPTRFKMKFHNWVVLHARYVCVFKRPRCSICFIKDLCEYKEKNLN